MPLRTKVQVALTMLMAGVAVAWAAHRGPHGWLAQRFGWSTAVMLILTVHTIYRTYMDQLARLRERQHHIEETEALHLRVIEGLAMAIEAKEQNTHGHLSRVRDYVAALGAALKLPAPELQALQIAAFLHDIGKLAIPEHILNKPGKLTPEEFETMKIHPSVGAEILERVRFPYPVVPMVRSHHEWWNGAGYPDGLKGEEIPLGARILTVVDCFDALTSDRPHRKGMPETQALEMIKSQAGRQFDPAVVDAFWKCHATTQLAASQSANTAGFTPLNPELEVWRGFAPGTGFETGSDENAPELRRGRFGLKAFGETSDTEVEWLVRTAKAREEAQRFFEISQGSAHTLLAHLPVHDSLRILSARLRDMIPHETCALYVKRGEDLRREAVVGEAAARFPPAAIRLGSGVSGWVAQQARPLLNGNTGAEPGCPSRPDGTPLFLSALAFPLFDPDQRLFAVLTLYAREADSFRKPHVRILQAMASKVALALGNTLEMERETPGGAAADFSLGLPNARRLYLHLAAELERCRNSGSSVSVTSWRLPALEEVRKRRGQLAGNRLLAKATEEFRRSLKAPLFVGRQGGDEFVCIAPAVERAHGGDHHAELEEQILAACRRASPGAVHGVNPGTAFFPADGITAEALLAVAARRMQRAKVATPSSPLPGLPSQTLVTA